MYLSNSIGIFGIGSDALEGLLDIGIAVFEFILGTIAGALWYIFSMLIEGLGWLYLNTPYPSDGNGDPTLWNPDDISGGSEADMWESGYEMYSEEILPIALVLFILAFILSYFGHLIKHFPGVNNNPNIGRILFLFLLVMAWWTVMTGVLAFSDGLTGLLAGGDTVSDVLDSDPSEDRLETEELYEDDEVPEDDETSEESWAGVLLLVALFSLSNFIILAMLIFWILRWLLVVMLGVGMPLFLSLRAFEGTGLPMIPDIGKKAWELWWFATFMTIPAAITLRLGTVMSEFGGDLGGGAAGAAIGSIIGFLTTAGIPVLAAFVPLLFYKQQMSVPGVGHAGALADKGIGAAGSTKDAASAYASSTGDTRKERLADAIDESDSTVANRVARRSSYLKDAKAGMTGSEREHHDRFGRDTDAGGRSFVHNASNMFASTVSDYDHNADVERDFNAEAAADAAGDDVTAEDIEDMDVSDETTRTAAQIAEHEANVERERETMKQRAEGADRDEMATDLAKMHEAVVTGDFQTLEQHGVDTSQMLSGHDEQLLREELAAAQTGAEVVDEVQDDFQDTLEEVQDEASETWESKRDKLERQYRSADPDSDIRTKYGTVADYLDEKLEHESADEAAEAAVTATQEQLLQKYDDDDSVSTLDDALLKEAAREKLDNHEDYNITTAEALTEAIADETKADFAAQRLDKEDLKEELGDGIREAGGVAPGETIEEATQEELQRWIGSNDWTANGDDESGEIVPQDPGEVETVEQDITVTIDGESTGSGSSEQPHLEDPQQPELTSGDGISIEDPEDGFDDGEGFDADQTVDWRNIDNS